MSDLRVREAAMNTDSKWMGRVRRAGWACAVVGAALLGVAGCSEAGADEPPAATPAGGAPMAAQGGEELPPAAPIRVEPELIDMGEITANERDQVEVVIRNTSDQEIVLTRVTASCSCLGGDLLSNDIPPGGEAKMNVWWSAGGVNSEQSKKLYVWWQGGKRPIEVPVKVNIVGGVEAGQPAPAPHVAERKPVSVTVEPTEADFGFLRPEEVREMTVRIKNTGEEALTLMRVSTDCSCATGEVDSTKEIAPGETGELKVTVHSRPNVGPLNQTLKVFVKQSLVPIDVKVKGQVSNPINAEPFFLNLLAGRTGEVTLEAIDRAPFHVLAVDGAAHVNGAAGGRGEPSIRHVVQWDLTDVPDESLQPWFIIETDHPEMPVIDFRVIHPAVIMKATPDPWTLSHDHLLLGWVQPGDVIEKEITLVKLASDTLESITSDDGSFDVEIVSREMTGRGLKLNLKITVKKPAEAPVVRSQLLVKTTEPEFTAPIHTFAKVGPQPSERR